MFFRITQRRIHSICFFWPPLFFCLVECVFPSIFNSNCKIQTVLQIRKTKVSSCSSIPFSSLQYLHPLPGSCFFSSPCCFIYPPFLSPRSSLLFLFLVFQLHLISFQLLCSDFLFSKIPDKKVLKNQKLVVKLLFSKVPN